MDGISGIGGTARRYPPYSSGIPSTGWQSGGRRRAAGPTLSDPVSLSQEGLELSKRTQSGSDDATLAPEAQQTVDELKRRDEEVKAHEQAHLAAGGDLVQGGASYQFETGPDGKQYAVGGEVQIDTSSERTPEATIRKMQQVRRAALAPADPSGTDRAVAAQAAQTEAQARAELVTQTARDQHDGSYPTNQSRTPASLAPEDGSRSLNPNAKGIGQVPKAMGNRIQRAGSLNVMA